MCYLRVLTYLQNTRVKFLFEVEILLLGCLSVSRLRDTAFSKGLSQRKDTANDMRTLEQFSKLLKAGPCSSILLLRQHCKLALCLCSDSRVNRGQVV